MKIHYHCTYQYAFCEVRLRQLGWWHCPWPMQVWRLAVMRGPHDDPCNVPLDELITIGLN